MYTDKRGDIFTTKAEAIGHGVNCRGLMGAGIAVAFKQRFQGMYEAYKVRCITGELQGGEVFPWRDDSGLWVYNIASQVEPGPNAKVTLFLPAMIKTLMHAEKHGVRSIAVPQIGCGIGGLDWPEVRGLLQLLSRDFPATEIEGWTYAT